MSTLVRPSLAPAALDAAALAGLVRTVAEHPAQWQQHVRFDAGSRYWHRLATHPGADLWLLTWLPEQGTDLHDHGDATAAFTVVQGELQEIRVRPGGSLVRSTLGAGSVRTVPAGAVHDVANRSSGPAVSIHAYSPSLTSMTFWEPAPDGLRRVSTVSTNEPEVAR
ncbi:MAG: putative cysteine dioxygenase [Frankiales bacterium]|nr:putative cysteine dioxygenase [Frankiales bacterium]